MRILYIDVDSLRADHLGCYNYHRDTSPHIDRIAEEAIVFDNCYVSDAPCLPSRTALWSGRCGFRTGVVNHAGARATPFNEGRNRWFRDLFFTTGWMSALRDAGINRTVTVSSFGERHAAWHWYAGFHEVYNSGKMGMDLAEDVADTALAWLNRHGSDDDWFLHLNFWDPHTPYRTPSSFGEPFDEQPLPEWLTEEVRRRQWKGFGPHSAQEPHGLGHEDLSERYPRMPSQLASMADVRQWIDGYDTGIRYMDMHIGRLLDRLAMLGVLDETAIIISADHGENQGELNVWGDHQTADYATSRVPLIIRWPGGHILRDGSLHYQYDWAATLVELLGGTVPDNWDALSFAPVITGETGKGNASRPYLVLSQNAWACQRSVRFDDYICLRTYHDGFKELEPVLLFNVIDDPHEERDLSSKRPDLVTRALAHLAEWQQDMARRSPSDVDPMWTVLQEGGPYHVRGDLHVYVERLRATDRPHHAERLLSSHG